MWATFSDVISGLSDEKLAQLFMRIQEDSSGVDGKFEFPKDETGWIKWLRRKFDKNEWEEIMERKPEEV